MAKAARKPARKMTAARDDAMDKRAGVREGSARDKALDARRGVPERDAPKGKAKPMARRKGR